MTSVDLVGKVLSEGNGQGSCLSFEFPPFRQFEARRIALLLRSIIGLLLGVAFDFDVAAQAPPLPFVVPSASVSGSVFTQVTFGTVVTDVAVPGVLLTMTDIHNPAIRSSVKSDEDGRFTFPIMPAGDYRVCWRASGFIPDCDLRPSRFPMSPLTSTRSSSSRASMPRPASFTAGSSSRMAPLSISGTVFSKSTFDLQSLSATPMARCFGQRL